MRRKSFRAHILEKKSPCRKMRLSLPAEVHSTDRPRISRAMGIPSRVKKPANPGPDKKEG
jgi:ribosomal protein L35